MTVKRYNSSGKLVDRIVFEKTCERRACSKPFETTRKAKKFCSRECSEIVNIDRSCKRAREELSKTAVTVKLFRDGTYRIVSRIGNASKVLLETLPKIIEEIK